MNTIQNLITKLLLAGLLSMLFTKTYSNNSLKQPAMKNDTTTYFQMKGKINITNKKVKGNYVVEVLYYNSPISSFNIKNDQAFMLLVKKNSPYTLRISKKGFMTQSIYINTNVNEAENRNEPYTFSLETDLISYSEAMRINEETLSLPAALISFNKETREFDHNKNYSTFVQQKRLQD